MISIIIPTFNEADQISSVIRNVIYADTNHKSEIIVVDGGSTDDTLKIAEECGAKVISSELKGRAAQMNKGASIARYDILYFLHADTVLPVDFSEKIIDAVSKGAKCGCFRLKFDHDNWFLKVNAWFTRINVNALRFGDQSLFVVKEVFEKSGKFREDLLMMEDQEIIHRLRKHGKFYIINDYIITSARKYIDNGVFRMQYIFYRLWAMYYLGYSQQQMLKVHRKLIRKHKL